MRGCGGSAGECVGVLLEVWHTLLLRRCREDRRGWRGDCDGAASPSGLSHTAAHSQHGLLFMYGPFMGLKCLDRVNYSLFCLAGKLNWKMYSNGSPVAPQNPSLHVRCSKTTLIIEEKWRLLPSTVLNFVASFRATSLKSCSCQAAGRMRLYCDSE